MAPRWSGLGLNPASSSERGEVVSELRKDGMSHGQGLWWKSPRWLMGGNSLKTKRIDTWTQYLGDRVTFCWPTRSSRRREGGTLATGEGQLCLLIPPEHARSRVAQML